jgi:CubicO group peptidase (beta-lactamase class C family)
MTGGDDVEAVITAVLRQRHCPGAVVAISTGGKVRTIVCGTATADTDEPVDAGRWFEIGSVTKLLVATLVLQHVVRGDIALDDPVRAHLPEFRLADSRATGLVTIRHLLTHASGIDTADDFTDTGSGDDCVSRYVETAVAGSGLVHPVGDRWSYNNAGYVVLGRLVELLDGRPWDIALDERILRPCAMDAANRRLAAGRAVAIGHHVDPVTGTVDQVAKVMPASVGPAGNVVATAEALVRFADCLFGETDEILPTGLVAEMLTPQIPVRDASQGLGWVLPDAPVPVAAHGGATIGFTAFLGAIPSVHSSIAVVANGPGAGAIALAAFAHLSRSPVVQPSVSTLPLDVDVARLVAGRYVRRHVVQDIELVDGRLIARTTFLGPAAELFAQPPKSELEPIGGRMSFVSRHPFEPEPARWDFLDPDGARRPARLFTQRVAVRAAT